MSNPPALFSIPCLAWCALATACSSPLDRPAYPTHTHSADLHTIHPVHPEDYPATDLNPDSDHELAPATAAAPAPAKLALTLEQCRAWVLSHNLELDARLIDPTLAQASVTAAEARFEAVFFGNAGFNDSQSPTATALEGSVTQNIDGQLGVRLPLRSGGTLTADFGGNRFETDNSFSILNPSFNSSASVSISQPLLRNAGRRVTETPIHIARLDARAADARTRLAVIRVLAEADRAYWRLYEAHQQLNVRQQQHQLAQSQLQRAQRLVDAGDAADIEVIRAQAGVADGLEAIITAENTLRQTQRQLKRLLNRPELPQSGPTVLHPATDPNPVHYTLDLTRLLSAATTQRVELIETQLALVRDALNIDLQRNATLPLATVSYRYARSGLGATFGDANTQIFEDNFDQHRVGLNIEVPLGNQTAKANLHRALLTRLQRLATREQQEAQITQEVSDALDTLDTTWQRILATRQSVLLEARVLEADQRQFDLGLINSTQVLESQTRLANARSREASALTAYQISQTDLAFATGTVLGQAQIRWEPAARD